MPKDDKKPAQKPAEKPAEKPSLRREFKEFTFGDDDAPKKDASPEAPAKEPAAPPAREPAKLKPEDMDFTPFRGGFGKGDADDEDDEETEEDWQDQLEYEQQQERTFDVARSFLPRNKTIRSALEDISNLEMQTVIACGILEEHYRGKLPDKEVNTLTVAALVLDAENYDDMFNDLHPDVIMIVDELRGMEEDENRATRLAMMHSMEPESRRVFLAFMAADLQMLQHEMEEGIDAGPDKAEHDDLAESLKVAAAGGDRALVRRIVNLYNDVAEAADLSTRVKLMPGGRIDVLPFPDIIAEKTPKPPKPPKNNGPKK